MENRNVVFGPWRYSSYAQEPCLFRLGEKLCIDLSNVLSRDAESELIFQSSVCPRQRSFHTRFYSHVPDASLACSNGFNPNRRMHSSHKAMPDESERSGSVLYPQEICSKRSSDIGFSSWLWTTKYNVIGTSRAPQPWMFILLGSKEICCR
jgi:hypothetical protein